MKRKFFTFAGLLIYMEIIYHIASFGFGMLSPILMFPIIIFVAGLQSLLCGLFRERTNKILLWCSLVLDYLIFASQLVYMSIFKQPLLFAAMTNAGKAAVTNYWREALYGILMVSGYLLLLAVPLVLVGVLLHKKKLDCITYKKRSWIEALIALTIGATSYAVILILGSMASTDYFEEFSEFFDPNMIIENYGVLPAVQRDIVDGILPEKELKLEAFRVEETELLPEESKVITVDESKVKPPFAQGGTQVPKLDTSPNVLPINFATLEEQEENGAVKKLAAYMQTMEPTKKNEYTGMFQGYNLIYLTAEGFSTYAIDEELTPTLYKLTHSGFVVDDYYVPLWQTSTSDGEYVNLTGLIPDQQFSLKRSAANEQPFSLPAYFAKEGVKSYAYHNNTLSYYDRHLSHPNLGYDFKASKLGDLSAEEWGDKVFPMDNANFWPSSDLDMMKATLPEYINDERFHAYYMTVSGHMNYNFTGNKMSGIHKEEVQNLPYSEEGKAYIACNIELDRALQYLIEELDKAGKLEKTVICLSADHYPYAMNIRNLEELAGRPLEGTLDVYRNSLILWNSEMETVEVEKTGCAADIFPTLLNLFDFDFDSRLFAGRDLLSDSPSLVIFSDRSFITDKIIYNRKAKTLESRTEEPVDETYYEQMKKQVKGIYEFSAGILQQGFYKYVEDALE